MFSGIQVVVVVVVVVFLVQSELDIVAEHRAESKFFIHEVMLDSLL